MGYLGVPLGVLRLESQGFKREAPGGQEYLQWRPADTNIQQIFVRGVVVHAFLALGWQRQSKFKVILDCAVSSRPAGGTDGRSCFTLTKSAFVKVSRVQVSERDIVYPPEWYP